MICKRNCFERFTFSFLKEAVITMDNKYRVNAISGRSNSNRGLEEPRKSGFFLQHIYTGALCAMKST